MRHIYRFFKAWQRVRFYEKTALVFILIIACAVRIAFINQPMRYDESFTFLYYASKPLSRALSDYGFPNNHVFHTFWVHLSTQIFENDPWAIRLPAFIAGILIIPFTYLCAHQFHSHRAALLAAALTAVSSPLIEYSTNARGYTLSALLFMMLFTLAYHLCQSRNIILWGIYSIVAALGMYTIPTMIYALIAVESWLLASILLENKGKQRIYLLIYLVLSSIGILILTGLLYLPIILESGLEDLTGSSVIASTPWDAFINQLPQALELTFTRWHRDVPSLIAISIQIGFIVSLIRHSHLSQVKLPPALPAIILLPGVILFQQVVPFTRVWLFLLPLYLMSASAGLLYLLMPFYVRLSKRWIALGIAALCLLLAGIALDTRSVYFSEETGSLRSAEALADYFAAHFSSDDVVIISVPGDLPLQYYFYQRGIRWRGKPRSYGTQPYIYLITRQTQTLDALLKQFGLDNLEGYSQPELLLELEDANLYRMTQH